MTDRELMQMALETLCAAVEPKIGSVYSHDFQPIDCAAMHLKAIEALRARLAQPEPEPVAWRFYEGDVWCYVDHLTDLPQNKFEPLYTAPPKILCGCGDQIMPDDGAECGNCVAARNVNNA